MEKPLPIDDVRLVFKPEGFNEDVIVRYIQKGPKLHWAMREPFSRRPEYTRYIQGTDIEIPWPSETILEPVRFECDTTRENVDQYTYVPSVINPPFEACIMDELKNKYSKAKREHDQAYVATKIIEDARSAWYDSRNLLTPRSQSMEQKVRKRQMREAHRRAANARQSGGLSQQLAELSMKEAHP